MANKDLFKQAIAEAKSVREAAIANAKEALEETLTPHLKDMLAAKLQEMEDKEDSKDENVEEVAAEEKAEAVDETLTDVSTVAEVEEDEAEDDSEESDDDAAIETPEDDAAPEMDAEIEGEEEIDGDEDLSKLSVDQFKDMIRDIIAQEVGGDAEMAADMDAGDIEGMGDEPSLEEPGMEGEPEMDAPEEDEIDLDELLRELDAVDVDEAHKADDKDEDPIEEDTSVEVPHTPEAEGKNINRTVSESDFKGAMETIATLRKELSEVNILNAKLLYVNKIFKANNLTESQKVNVIAAFDKAETVKEVKLVFETVVDNVGTKKVNTVKEHRGSASKATGITASKKEVITEVSSAVLRMQKLAGIIK